MQVERGQIASQEAICSSGERVRNTWGTNPPDGDNLGKPGLIPDTLDGSHDPTRKAPADWDGPAAYQLVGGVTAHQGIDG